MFRWSKKRNEAAARRQGPPPLSGVCPETVQDLLDRYIDETAADRALDWPTKLALVERMLRTLA